MHLILWNIFGSFSSLTVPNGRLPIGRKFRYEQPTRKKRYVSWYHWFFFHNWSTLIPIMTPNKHKVVTRENDVVNINWAPFYLHWLPLIPAGIRNDIHCNVWLYRACDFLNLNMLAKGSPDVLYVICVMRVICRNGLASPRQWKIELTFGLLDSEWGGMS